MVNKCDDFYVPYSVYRNIFVIKEFYVSNVEIKIKV